MDFIYVQHHFKVLLEPSYRELGVEEQGLIGGVQVV